MQSTVVEIACRLFLIAACIVSHGAECCYLTLVLNVVLMFCSVVLVGLHALSCAGLVFEGVGFFDVGIAVFFGNYETLAKHLLICNSAELCDQQIGEHLQNLLRPVVPKTV